MLDLPVRNLMSDVVVVTIRRSASLDEVVETMFERDLPRWWFSKMRVMNPLA